MSKRRLGSVGRDLLVAVAGFGLILSVVYTFGRLFIPSDGFLSVLATAEVPQDGESSLLLDLRADLLALDASAAVVEVSGAVDDRLLLDHVDRFSAGGFEGESIHLSVTYRGDRGVLLLAGSDLVVGVPASAGVTATLTTEGKTFIAKDGECVSELSRFESDPALPIPRFSGELVCTDVPELRTEATASFVVVFEFEPELEPHDI